MPPAVPRPLSDGAIRFRGIVIDALWDDRRFGYIDAHSFVGTCPVCGDAVVVHFIGAAPRASVRCTVGCSEAEIADAIGLEVE